jgi:hypothetical protein
VVDGVAFYREFKLQLSSFLRQQYLQIFSPQVADQPVVRTDDGGSQVALGFLELQDFFFHRVACDQPIGKNVLRLSYAMSAVNGLRLDCRIPPTRVPEPIAYRLSPTEEPALNAVERVPGCRG